MGLPFTYRGMTLVDGSFSVRGIHIGLDTYNKRSDDQENADKLWDINIMKKHRIIFGRTHCKGALQLRAAKSSRFKLIKPRNKFKCGYAR